MKYNSFNKRNILYIILLTLSLSGGIAYKPISILRLTSRLENSPKVKKFIVHPLYNLYDSFKLTVEDNQAWDYRKRKISSGWHDLVKTIIPAHKYLYHYSSLKADESFLPGGYIDYINNNEVLGTNGKGEMFLLNLAGNSITKVPSNLNYIYRKQEYSGKVIPSLRGRFGIRDLYIDRDNNYIYISISVDVNGKGCYGMAIYKANIDSFNTLISDQDSILEFREFYKTNVCNSNFNGHAIGGRIEKLKENIIFTVGSLDFTKSIGGDGIKDISKLLSLKNAAGKVISIDQKGNMSILSSGHRNQQGLAVFKNRIIITEHGPKGGDEINLIEKGSHYGWPYFAYGFEYNNNNTYRTKHVGNVKKPIFYFTPSIGIGELIYYQGNEFPFWKNKIIVSSLKTKSIYILDYDLNTNSIISSERIYLGHRIRDLLTLPNGKIIALTDDQRILTLRRSSIPKYDEKATGKFILPIQLKR